MATVANPAAIEATRKSRKSAKPKKAQQPKPKVSKMAKKKKGSSKKKSSSSKKRPRRSNPENPRRHGTVTIPRGMMLVPVGGAARNPSKKKKGRRPQRRNPEPPHHTMLKNGAEAVAFGTLAAAAGMLGGYALSKANMKSKVANVAANVATGAVVGGGIGMVDRVAGTVVAHNYMVAAAQWLTAPAASTTAAMQGQGQASLPGGRSGGASPQMLNRANAMHAVDDDMGQPDPEAITRPRPAPRARGLGGYRGVSGLGSPLDHLGSPLDHLGGYDHVEGIVADDVSDPSDMEGFQHLNGIMADNLGDELESLGDDLDSVMADDVGEEELAAGGDDMDGDDELGFIRG